MIWKKLINENELSFDGMFSELKLDDFEEEAKKESEKQIQLFEKCVSYIEDCTKKDVLISEHESIKNRKLVNYKIIQDGMYIRVVDKYKKDPKSKGNYRYATISLGNKKLENDKHKVFAIWNVLQRVTCVNSTKDCKQFCYANQYPHGFDADTSKSRKLRMKNTAFSMFENAGSILIEVLKFLQDTNANSHIIVRFHEAGDVYSPLYFSKLKQVMDECLNMKFMWYTKSLIVLDHINEINKKEHVSLRYSLDNSTPSWIVEKVNKLNCLKTTVVPVEQLDECLLDDRINFSFCNTHKNKRSLEETLNSVNKLLVNLQKEKSCENISQHKINNLEAKIKTAKKHFINKDTKCTNCMKCFSKIKTIAFAQHGK